MAVRIVLRALQNGAQRPRLRPAPFRGDMRRSATNVGVRFQQIAMQMADAAAADIAPVPYFPAMARAGLFVAHHEPVVVRNQPEY